MSWAAGLDYMTKYQNSRLDALNNKKVRKWFTAESTDLQDMAGKFGNQDECKEWLTAYTSSLGTGQDTPDKLYRPAAKADILAGWYRDLYIMYGAGPSFRVRSNADQDRFEYLRTISRIKKTEQSQTEFT